MNQVFGSHFYHAFQDSLVSCLFSQSLLDLEFCVLCIIFVLLRSLWFYFLFFICVCHFFRSCRVYHCLQYLYVCSQSLPWSVCFCCLVWLVACLMPRVVFHVCLFACLCPCSIQGLRPISYSVWTLGLSLLCVRPQAHPHFILGLVRDRAPDPLF